MKRQILVNAILWSAAIVAAAALDAPHVVSLILLPTLAFLSLLATDADTCFKRSELS